MNEEFYRFLHQSIITTTASMRGEEMSNAVVIAVLSLPAPKHMKRSCRERGDPEKGFCFPFLTKVEYRFINL